MEMAEVLACSCALSFAQDLSLFQVVLVGDSLRVIQAINSLSASLTLFGHVIDEI